MTPAAQIAALVQRRPLLIITLGWAAISLMLALVSPHLAERRFPDVDDALRLVQVRDLLAGQAWFDVHQYRMAPPEGTLMHWSRLVDIPLAASLWLLMLVLPASQAELITVIAIPLLLLLATMLVVGRLASERLGGAVAVCAGLAMVAAPMVPTQFQPMRIDHHGWQILCVAVALWAVFRHDARRGAMIAGLAMASGMLISLETIVMAASFAALLTLRWLSDPRASMGLVRYLQSLAAGLAGLFAATRGLADLAPHCDVIAPAHLGFFGIVAIGASLLALRRGLHPAAILAGLAASGLAGLVWVGWMAPACLAPPFAGLDPLVRDNWYLNVTEGLPIWRRPLAEALPAALQTLLALGIAGYAALRGAPPSRGWWREYALLLALAILAGFATYRSMAFAGMMATIPLGWFATRMIARWQASPSLLGKLGAAALLYMAVLPAALTSLLLLPFAKAPSGSLAFSTCELHRNIARLDALPETTLFTQLDIGGYVLLDTDHKVIASAHHRAVANMREVIAAFVSPPETARAHILASGASHVVMCADSGEMSVYSHTGGPDSLAARLAKDAPPAWLAPVALGMPESLRVWRVVPAP